MATETPSPPEGFDAAESPDDNSGDDYDTERVDRPELGEALQGELIAKKPNRGQYDSMIIEVRLTEPYKEFDTGDLVHMWCTNGIEKQLTDQGDTDPVPRMSEIYLYVSETFENDDGETVRGYEVTYKK